MSTSDTATDHYIIENGTALQIFKDWEARTKAQDRKRSAFLKRMGTEKFYSLGEGYVSSLMFADEQKVDKTLWRRHPKNNGWIPRKQTPEGKALYKEMCSLGGPRLTDLTYAVLNVGDVLCGLRMHFPGFEYVQGKPVILMPNPWGDKAPPKPINTKTRSVIGYEFKLVDGVRKMKASEFWAMKEAEGNATANKRIKQLQKKDAS